MSSHYVHVTISGAKAPYRSFEMSVSSIEDLRRKIAYKLFFIPQSAFNEHANSRKVLVDELVCHDYVPLYDSPEGKALIMYIAPVIPPKYYLADDCRVFETWFKAWRYSRKHHLKFKKVAINQELYNRLTADVHVGAKTPVPDKLAVQNQAYIDSLLKECEDTQHEADK